MVFFNSIPRRNFVQGNSAHESCFYVIGYIVLFFSETPRMSFYDGPMQLLVGAVVTLLAIGGMFFYLWIMESRRRREVMGERLDDGEPERLDLEKRRLVAQEEAHPVSETLEKERTAAETAGPGLGGYIVVEMPEHERSLFHDLLKGFEDYAKLKGYEIAFSIDSTLRGRIAFKFTVHNDGTDVGSERVGRDFKEYMENVRSGQVDDLDNLPVITSLEEHNLIVTLLKNRLSFLQHSYQLSRNAVQFYEKLITNVRSFPALSTPSVIVQTGGTMGSRKYDARHSSRLIQGDSNTFEDSSVNIDIGQSFTQKQERIAALDDVIAKLKTAEQTESAKKAQRALATVRDELVDHPEPDKSTIRRLMENAKSAMLTGALSYEVVEAGKKLFELFGLS